MGYSYTAFRQAMMFYEDVAHELGEDMFEQICTNIAARVTVRPELRSLMELATASKHAGAIVLTCGLCGVWEKVMERVGLQDKVEVIGGGRLEDGFVVTPTTKAALVSRLRNHHQLYVCAFGDSPMDLPMLQVANEAIVIVGEERTRSKTMDIELTESILAG